ncbi:MAG: winged helix-turn-helix transcriptional regulator [Thaumarchaeota archaeon]|nr:winged helix-turn-helix transcriptional regulator [Nitrososphaerota archaeon]
MTDLGELLGSETRAKIVASLAVQAGAPTAYMLAKENGVNVAKVYGEMKRLARLGVVKAHGEGRGVGYELVDGDLRRLARRYGSRMLSYGEWASRGARTKRFRMGLARVPAYEAPGGEGGPTKPTRLEGELDTLAALGRKRFNAKYVRTSARSYARL